MYFGLDVSEVHCGICGCPKEIWEPFKTYDGRCCELYSDVFGLVFDDDIISFERLLCICEELRSEYADIPDFKVTIREIFDILEDCGVINHGLRKPKLIAL